MKFVYSFKEDYKEAKNMKDNPHEYNGLLSIVWPDFTLRGKARAFFMGKLSIFRAYYVWLAHQEEIKKAFRKHKLKLPHTICYLCNFGCSGWFDIDAGTAYVRFTKSSNSDLVENIIHELLHLVTYEEEYDHRKRESVADDYLEKMNFSFINFKRQNFS
jgi:hypothetical protein